MSTTKNYGRNATDAWWELRVEPVFALKFTQKIAILSYQIYIAAIIFVQGKLAFQAGYAQLNMREFRKDTTTELDSSDEQGIKILAKWTPTLANWNFHTTTQHVFLKANFTPYFSSKAWKRMMRQCNSPWFTRSPLFHGSICHSWRCNLVRLSANFC